MIKKESLSAAFNSSREWIGDRLAPDKKNIPAPPRRLRIAIACAAIFLVAAGVRFLQWQDLRVDFERGESMATKLIKPYQSEARRMAEDGGLLFPRNAVDPSDARMIVHPPGYSILIRAFYKEDSADESYAGLRLSQIFCDSAATVLVFLIAAELLAFGVALIGALLAAVSPHLAYYSLYLSPEILAALPILIAVYLIIRAHKRPRLITVVMAGAMIGLSCWLRSNALLLAPLLGVALLFLLERGKRWRYAAALVGAAALVISPITIRNWVVYGNFIPLSIGSGITMIEGISDYDEEKRFGLPATDTEVEIKDAEWHSRPDYAENLWKPDGIARDRARFARGVEVISSNPGWFLGVMLRRSAFMVRYNDSRPAAWPLYTSKVPVVAAEPPFGHPAAIADESQPVWSRSAEELISDGVVTSPQAEVSLREEGRALEIKGDGNEFQDQFASAPIAIEEGTNYVLRLSVKSKQGAAAAKVTSGDRRITLVSGMLLKREISESESRMDAYEERPPAPIDFPFASGNRTEVRLVISNDIRRGERAVVEVGGAELFKIGPTPHRATAYPRVLVRGLQKNLFKTDLMRALIVLGILLLALAKRRVALLCLLAVPIYYLALQSALHTEYRYVLLIHYFLFVMAAAAIYAFVVTMIQAGRAISKKVTELNTLTQDSCIAKRAREIGRCAVRSSGRPSLRWWPTPIALLETSRRGRNGWLAILCKHRGWRRRPGEARAQAVIRHCTLRSLLARGNCLGRISRRAILEAAPQLWLSVRRARREAKRCGRPLLRARRRARLQPSSRSRERLRAGGPSSISRRSFSAKRRSPSRRALSICARQIPAPPRRAEAAGRRLRLRRPASSRHP